MKTAIVEREFAPFKVNLMLHVVGKRTDGYHLLETLFAFADGGDELTWEPAEGLWLEVSGPFAPMAPAGPDNLVMRAAAALATAFPKEASAGGRLTLQKRVPAGAGLGGGSADAAATLRLLNRVWHLGLEIDVLSQFAATLGADVPACVFSRPAWARGVGADLSFLAPARRLPLLVIFPGKPLSTRQVFSGFNPLFSKENEHWPPAMPEPGEDLFWRNDLEMAAAVAEPVVADVLDSLARMVKDDRSTLLSGMSGSGSACFVLYRADSAAQHLATRLRERYPASWLYEGTLISPFI